MSGIKAIKAAVTALPPEDLAEFDSARWDSEIEQDMAAGQLDAFLAEAQADYLSRGRLCACAVKHADVSRAS